MRAAFADNNVVFFNEFLFGAAVCAVGIAKGVLNGGGTERQMEVVLVAAQVKVQTKGAGFEVGECRCPFINAYLQEVGVIAFFVDGDSVLVGECYFTHKIFYLTFCFFE